MRRTEPTGCGPAKSHRGVELGAALPRALDQDIGFTADPGGKLGRQGRFACRAQPRRALLDQRIGKLRHAGGGGAGPRAVRKDVHKGEPAFRDEIEAAAEHLLGLGRKPGDQIGAERHLRAQCPGTPGDGDRLGARMPPLHPLQDQIVAGLQRQVQMRHQPLLFGQQPPQLVVDLGRVERGEPQALELGHRGEQPAHHLAEARRAWQIGAVGRQIDAGQHDLPIAGRDETARLVGDETHRHRSAGTAGVGDDAKGAAVVAALLDLQKGAALALEAVDEMAGGLRQICRSTAPSGR